MVNSSPETLNTVFAALSDPTRRSILQRLSYGEATVTEVAAPFMVDMSLPAVSKHLRILEAAGLIVRRKTGREHHLRLAAAPMKDAAEWLDVYRQFWEAQFDALAAFLRDNPDDATS
jgi:DNA-binding transcriptional ArsR family regulator